MVSSFTIISGYNSQLRVYGDDLAVDPSKIFFHIVYRIAVQNLALLSSRSTSFQKLGLICPTNRWCCETAINQRGEVVVTEFDEDCVSPSGERLRSFGTQGSGQGKFVFPAGITIYMDRNNNILAGLPTLTILS